MLQFKIRQKIASRSSRGVLAVAKPPASWVGLKADPSWYSLIGVQATWLRHSSRIESSCMRFEDCCKA